MKLLRVVLSSCALVACATPSAPPPPPPVEAPPPPPETRIHRALDGTWTGTADVSPFGPWPYTIVFHHGANAIVGETPPPVGGKTALGGYQRLVLKRDASGAGVCEYKASVKEGFAEGRLVEVESNDDRLVYCAKEGCDRMKLAFELDAEGQLRFVTDLAGAAHSGVTLTLKAAASSPPEP